MKQINFMKQVQGLLVLLMLAFAVPMLTACSNDKEDEPETTPSVVGMWKIVKTEYYDKDKGTYYESGSNNWYTKYYQDGKYEWYKSDMTTVQGRGTWEITNDKLTVRYTISSDNSLTVRVYSFSLNSKWLILINESDKRRDTYECVN